VSSDARWDRIRNQVEKRLVMRQSVGIHTASEIRAMPALRFEYIYNTPLVLGTSSPPVLWIASRIASATALNADSALTK
jgi:hypothetical protein